MLQKLEQFSYATGLDLSMWYYHIPLDEKSQKLCTTILPWGKYSYAKLPMGLSCSPDILQNIMNELLGDLQYVLVYIDDILILNTKTETAEDHIAKIDQVLKRLEKVGFGLPGLSTNTRRYPSTTQKSGSDYQNIATQK